LPVVVVAAFLLLRVSQNSPLRGDTAIALISTGALALGVMVITLSGGGNTELYAYMFGSVFAITGGDVWISGALCLAILVLYVGFYPKIFAIIFDEDFARATGARAGLYNSLLALLTAVTVVLGMRMVGALLISALIIFPPVTAMRVCGSFRATVVCAGVLSVCCFVLGIVLSYIWETPAGASVVCVNIAAFVVFSGVGYVRRRGD
ncbi:MAG: metal ABC transporter permease, partial [Clostridia bacterium]|nr:metal ABC transporter permease [Clostridia bacterium]